MCLCIYFGLSICISRSPRKLLSYNKPAVARRRAARPRRRPALYSACQRHRGVAARACRGARCAVPAESGYGRAQRRRLARITAQIIVHAAVREGGAAAAVCKGRWAAVRAWMRGWFGRIADFADRRVVASGLSVEGGCGGGVVFFDDKFAGLARQGLEKTCPARA